MKRKHLLALAVVVVLLLPVFWLWNLTTSEAPRFVSAPPNFKVGRYDRMFYPFLIPRPFEGGLVWITIIEKSALPKKHVYLYDIEQKKVLGELINGWPLFGNRDQSKVLLSTAPQSLKQRFFETLKKITGSKGNFGNRAEGFIAFDRIHNQSKAIGRVEHYVGSGSRWYPSPDYHYGFTQPTADRDTLVVYDQEKSSMSKNTLRGYGAGWWNETNILYQTDDNDLALYDVVKAQTSILLRNDEIKAFVNENHLGTNSPIQQLSPFAMWDGKQYQFYLTDNNKRWQALTAPLAKIERPSGKLKLIDADFKFDWSDSFDEKERYYIYSGRNAKAGDKVSAVYLRDLKNGTTRTLVEDCGVNQHSIPQIYGESVIYSRSNMLWRIGFNETNSTRIFPPPGE